ncbi:MAG: FtsX-like permease family protein, partial [Marinoscillum sp.]
NDSYKAEQKLSVITMIFSGLAVLVACLGLFGLATYAVEQRKKEIGVRKVLGITTPQILMLLSKEFLLLIGVAFVISVPSAYLILDEWLSGFAFRIGIEIWPFVVAGGITLLVAFTTMTYHALRASLINPAETLKYE